MGFSCTQFQNGSAWRRTGKTHSFVFFFLFLGCSRHLRSEYNPSHICQSIGICLNSSVLYIYYSHQLSLHIQFLHGPTANDAHNANSGKSKGPLMSKLQKNQCRHLNILLDLGFPLPLKREGSLTLMVDRSWDFTKGRPGPARGLSCGNRIIDSETCLLVNQSQEFNSSFADGGGVGQAQSQPTCRLELGFGWACNMRKPKLWAHKSIIKPMIAACERIYKQYILGINFPLPYIHKIINGNIIFVIDFLLESMNAPTLFSMTCINCSNWNYTCAVQYFNCE